MDGQPNIGTGPCPPTTEAVVAEARQAFEELICFCLSEERTFGEFEKRLSYIPHIRRVISPNFREGQDAAVGEDRSGAGGPARQGRPDQYHARSRAADLLNHRSSCP